MDRSGKPYTGPIPEQELIKDSIDLTVETAPEPVKREPILDTINLISSSDDDF